jgi:RimJ/RimL family protein N-acetyltransferase/GNAT superfamily N-acetyltransferase
MKIYEIVDNKRDYMDLLFLADEQEDMIDRYLDRGTMYVIDDNGVKGECVVTDEGEGILEIKNIATVPESHGKGYGRLLINYISEKYAGQYLNLQVGTGDSPLTIPFYEKCGFRRHHIIKNFFLDNYDHPIFEEGIQLVDMVYLRKAITKVLKTDRLILRLWEESDAEDLYKYARNPDVGPIAGWPAHQSLDESREVIKNVFNGKEAYAICLKEDGKAIGAIELKLNGHTDMTERDDECELGYWLGKPFWGQGLMPEAAREILRHAFEDIGMSKVWCGYYEGNTKSKRVQEKVGFKYQWTTESVDVPLMHEKRTGHVNAMTKEEWQTLL